jgi:transcriptional regulator with XRE-family HTH domain
VAKRIGADKKRELGTLREALGAVVTELRKRKGWSQRELAHRLGYELGTVRNFERAIKSPNLRTVEVFARGFSMEVSTLIRAAERRIKK